MSTKARREDGYSVYKRKDGRWVAAVTIGHTESGNPKRKTVYAKTRREALETAQEMKREYELTGIPATSKDVTLEEFMKEWLEEVVKPNRAPKTYDYYFAFNKRYLNPALGSTPLRKLQLADIQRLMNKLRAQGLSTSTVKGVRGTLRAALNVAKRMELIGRNVADNVTLPRHEVAERRTLSPVEFSALLEACRGEAVGDLVAFAVCAGTRLGECSGVTWDVVNLDAGTVHIKQQLQRIESKLVLRSLKSLASRRVLPLEGILREAVFGEISGRGRQDALTPDFVFRNTEGRPWDPKNANDHLKRLCKKAEIQEISFHVLRHTAATLALSGGAGLHQVKGILGHSQIALTANLYGHHVDAGHRFALQAIQQSARKYQH